MKVELSPIATARAEGGEAFIKGLPFRQCPYPKESYLSNAWEEGWLASHHRDSVLHEREGFADHEDEEES